MTGLLFLSLLHLLEFSCRIKNVRTDRTFQITLEMIHSCLIKANNIFNFLQLLSCIFFQRVQRVQQRFGRRNLTVVGLH